MEATKKLCLVCNTPQFILYLSINADALRFVGITIVTFLLMSGKFSHTRRSPSPHLTHLSLFIAVYARLWFTCLSCWHFSSSTFISSFRTQLSSSHQPNLVMMQRLLKWFLRHLQRKQVVHGNLFAVLDIKFDLLFISPRQSCYASRPIERSLRIHSTVLDLYHCYHCYSQFGDCSDDWSNIL
jgi:hypothetical protein